MKRNNSLVMICFGICFIIIIFSCEKETIVPINLEDKTFSFSEDIQSILDSKCSGCHTDLKDENSYDFLSSKDWITTEATKAEDSKLYEKINTSHVDGRLTSVEKRSLELWMEQGAENN